MASIPVVINFDLQRCCKLTGIPFDLSIDVNDRTTHFRPYAASLDRKVPGLGYVKSNVEIVCMAINLGFNQFGREAFDNLIAKYLEKKGMVIQPISFPELTKQQASE